MMLASRAQALLDSCRRNGLRIAAAESCTGGLLSAYLTDIPGSSDVFERGFVTYSNEAKFELLGVPSSTISNHGAVSRETAIAMAMGALKYSHADIAVSITGVAGPGGGSPEKPVGLVHFALAQNNMPPHPVECRFDEKLSRKEIRDNAVAQALSLLEWAVERGRP